MMKFYRLFYSNNEKYGVAYANIGKTLAEIIDEIKNVSELPFEFILKDGIKSDFISTNICLPLFSKKFMESINEFIDENHKIEWVSAKLKCNGKYLNYYVPKFTVVMKVLDSEKTITTNYEGIIGLVKAVFAKEKIKKFHFFPAFEIPFFSNEIEPVLFTQSIVLSKKLKAHLKNNKISGIDTKSTIPIN